MALRYLTIILLAITPLLLSAQREERPLNAPASDKKHRNVWDERGRKQGVHKMYSVNEILIWEIEYVNDKKHGLCLKYYAANGKLKEESYYFDGRREGEYKKMYFSGNTNMEGEYIDGKRTGHWTKYSNLTTEVLYEGDYEEGKKSGEWKYYDSKGGVKAKGNYKNDKKDGAWEYYDKKGQVALTKVFKDGVEDKPDDGKKTDDKNAKAGTAKSTPKKTN